MPAIDYEPWPRTHAEHRAALEKRGYREIPDHKGIKPGARIHHRGQRYAKAQYHAALADRSSNWCVLPDGHAGKCRSQALDGGEG